ncbi:unnamed protein product [Cladocopium goreaui]|uniref:Crinkler effector protein 15 n=1 Tax=Cladocopium goreaui TaxID=2562237 RepID=A0A9P1BPB1_9DINO|nr:unnamed protein product [Cladocopium goreaui]
MVALRNARVRRYVLLCHFFRFWHFAARTLQFSALPPNTKLLKDVEHNEMPNWIREQMCDLGYDKGVSDNMAEALSFYSPSALVEASRESLLGALQQTFPNDAQRMIMAQSLYDRIQKGITQPQPVQSDVPENVKAFARALDDAELEGQILRTETGSFKLQNVSEIWDEKQFYVRGCYTEIADIMLKKKPPVMSLELKDFPVFLHQRDIIHLFQKGKEPKKVDVKTLRSAPAQALYIMDADIDVEHGVFCQSLWITSTAVFNTEHFKKAERFSGQFFMPPWTLTEMLSAEVMALHKLNEEVVKERFGIFGGTARLVLERDETRAGVDRRRLVEAVQSADALQCLKVSSDMKAISKTTHLLVKMMPRPDFSWFDVQLSSPYVRQELVKQNRQDNSEELWKRMREGMITGIGFALFEEEFHQFMQDKSIGKFKLRARCLTAEGKGSDTTQELQGGLEGVLISGNPAADIKDGEYYQPQSKNFPAFDSWTSQGVFQLTIADTHDITFNDSGKAMFQFDKWKTVQTVKQPEMAEKIEQWVVCFEQNLPK